MIKSVIDFWYQVNVKRAPSAWKMLRPSKTDDLSTTALWSGATYEQDS